MKSIKRGARCILALLWFYFLPVVSFSSNYHGLNICRSTITSQWSRRHFARGFNGIAGEHFALKRHDNNGRSLQLQASQLHNKRCPSPAKVASPLFAGQSTNLPPAEKKVGIIRSLRKLIFFPLRFFIMRPIRYLMELLVDEIDLEDGTAIVAQPLEEACDELPVVVQDEKSTNDTSVSIQGGPLKTNEEGSTVARRLAPPTKDTVQQKRISSSSKPAGTRWAVAAPDVDLTGEWVVLVTDEFKQEYDRYLTQLGQPMLVRSVALGIISLTTEVTKQFDSGKSLLIRGQNVRGTWDRTLVASGTEIGQDDYTPLIIPVMSADSEKVEAESWWEDDGRVHVSWLRGVKKYGGGAFESKRFLDGDTYVCESTFHPNDSGKQPNRIIWRFRRQSAN